MNRVALLRVLQRRKAFRWLFGGMLFYRIGDAFSLVALTWLALDLAGPRGVGLVLVIGGIASTVSAPAAGHLLDRFGLRPMLLLDNVLRGLIFLAAAALVWSGAATIAYLCVLAFLDALLGAVTEVGEQVAVPALVEDEELEAGNTLISVIWDTAAWVGPAMAGFTIEVAGAAAAFGVNAASFFMMALTALRLPGRPAMPGDGETDESGSWLARALVGFSALWRLKPVLVMAGVTVGVLLLSGAVEVLLPVYTRTTLDGGAAEYGLLVAVAGGGSLLGTIVLTPFLGRLRPAFGIVITLVLRGMLILPLAFTDLFAVACVFLAASSLADGPYFPLNRTISQRYTPVHLRGRVLGAKGALGVAGFPLGAALGGILLASASTGTAVVLIALVFLALAVPPMLTPQLRRRPDRSGAAAEAPEESTVI